MDITFNYNIPRLAELPECVHMEVHIIVNDLHIVEKDSLLYNINRLNPDWYAFGYKLLEKAFDRVPQDILDQYGS